MLRALGSGVRRSGSLVLGVVLYIYKGGYDGGNVLRTNKTIHEVVKTVIRC